MKSYSEAHRHEGGFNKWVYDRLKYYDAKIKALEENNIDD